MLLKRLYLLQFRNLERMAFTPAPRFNVFYGANGQGKTNILESIFLLATLKSFKLAKNRELINWSTSQSLIKGWVEKDGVIREIALLIDKEGKKVKLDQKSITRVDEFFGHLNVVVFTPEEISMAKGGPDLRRKYLDRAVFSSELAYLSLFHDYSRILRSRNVLLRTAPNSSELDVWTEKLVEHAVKIVAKRIEYLSRLQYYLQKYHLEISGTADTVEIMYRPFHMDCKSYDQDCKGAMQEAIKRNAQEEIRRGTTLIGPHRDDVDFLLNGRLLKKYGSQGQQRCFILALKMAEIEQLHQQFDNPPILLLDDMTSELDEARNRNLMQFLRGKEMQVFITTTSLQNVGLDRTEDHCLFHISEGKLLS